MDGGNSFLGKMVFQGNDCVSAKVGLQPPSWADQNHFMEGADTRGGRRGEECPRQSKQVARADKQLGSFS